MKIRKITALLLCLCFTLICCGCKTNRNSKENEESKAEAEITTANMLYCANDTFNPYTLTTKVNMELCQLLYEPLIKLDNSFNPIYALAEGAEQDGKIWTITLKNAKFSDGSEVTGDDVVYSYKLAKNSAVYSSALTYVKAASAENNKVTFTLAHCDPYFLNLLSFPILKKDSDKVYNDDSVLFPPIGAGRYLLNDDRTGLVLNKNYYGAGVKFDTINLINAPDNDSISHYVEVGATDFYYADTSDGKIFRMDGKKFTINQNRLIYLGMNLNLSVFKEPKVRYCISAALDRTKIATNAYYGNAVPAAGPLNPAWDSEDNYQFIETSSNKKIAIENLEQIGYNKLDSLGYRTNHNGKSLEFTLLINADNPFQQEAAKLIVSQLNDVGIRVTIRALNYENYLNALSMGAFQLYIAEIKINNNFDIAELVLPGGSCAFGIPDSSAENDSTDEADNETQDESYGNSLPELIKRYRNGTVSLPEVVSAVSAQMPFIPLCYRSGVLFYSNNINEITKASADDLFMSLEK